jgi:hypothetical protein
MFKLRGVEPIAQGNKRFVFQHPNQPNLLIKVWKPDVVEERWGGERPWYKPTRRYGQYISFQREMSEYLALAVKFPDGVSVLQKLAGIVDTDYGIGVVVEKLVGRDGGLAPNLAALAHREGVTPRILGKIDQFQKELLHFGVRVGKLHDRNLVLAMHNGEERFVMVDGYGEKAAIPIHAWSSRLNSIHTRRRVQILLERLHKQYGASLAR